MTVKKTSPTVRKPRRKTVKADAKPELPEHEEQPAEIASENEASKAQDVPSLPDVEGWDKDLEVEGVWVRSVGPRFRRAGYSFTQAGNGIALHALSEQDLEQLEAEPALVVERVTFTEVPFTRPEAK
ncbi:HI1506-related protein [Neptuniibacter marinus]|uniref:HI1506-related protein n=1 Tax=Neptuniibacter marinus TaxID=1806670 RepID=UPI003B58D32F